MSRQSFVAQPSLVSPRSGELALSATRLVCPLVWFTVMPPKKHEGGWSQGEGGWRETPNERGTLLQLDIQSSAAKLGKDFGDLRAQAKNDHIVISLRGGRRKDNKYMLTIRAEDPKADVDSGA